MREFKTDALKNTVTIRQLRDYLNWLIKQGHGDVKVIKVNTISVKGKEKRVGRSAGMTSDWKKAIVTIDTNPNDQKYTGKGGKVTKVSKKYKDSIEGII